MYYRLLDDLYIPDRWDLDEPVTESGDEIDSRLFTIAKRYEGQQQLYIPINIHGEPLDFTFAGFEMPVVRSEVCDIFEKFSKNDIQRIPVIIGDNTVEGFEILNILTQIDCVDEKRSEYEKWKKSDHRSDLAGEYRSFTLLKIDPDAVQGKNIFRIKKWEIEIIISDQLRLALESHGVNGVSYDLVI